MRHGETTFIVFTMHMDSFDSESMSKPPPFTGDPAIQPCGAFPKCHGGFQQDATVIHNPTSVLQKNRPFEWG